MGQLLGKWKKNEDEKAGGFIPTPEAKVTGVDIKWVNLQSADFVAEVSVTNPYFFPLPICRINFSLDSAGREIANGRIPEPGWLKSGGVTVMYVHVQIPYSSLVTVAGDIGLDWDIDYDLHLNLMIFDLPILRNITIPVSFKGEMKLPTIKDVINI